MIAKFRFNSNYFHHNEICNEMEVEVSIKSYNGCEAMADIESVFDKHTNEYRSLESFPDEELLEMASKAQGLADDRAVEAYQDYLEFQADRLMDEMKERE